MDAHVGTAIFTDLEREELVGSVLNDCRALLVICGGSGTSEEVRWALERGVSVIPLASSGADRARRLGQLEHTSGSRRPPV